MTTSILRTTLSASSPGKPGRRKLLGRTVKVETWTAIPCTRFLDIAVTM